MKLTKSMVYQPTDASRELTLYAQNSKQLYFKQACPVMNSLKKKLRAGSYDRNKAVAIWYRHACAAAKRYNAEYSTPGVQPFTVQDRYTCAVELEQHYFDIINFEVKGGK